MISIFIKKYLTNLTVWCCYRYSKNGLANLGSKLQGEYEQLLSEHLSVSEFDKLKTSYIALIILDMAYISEDKMIFMHIANDL